MSARPVAMVVAETLRPGARRRRAGRGRLRAAAGRHDARRPRVAPGAPLLSPEVPGNICIDWRTGDADGRRGGVRRGGARRHAGARQSSRHHQPDGAARLGRHVRSERPAATRCTSPARASTPTATTPPAALGVEPKDVRFIAPDVGGGFGAKNFIYAEHILVAWAARRVGRPVKWIATRSEVFLADHPSRDHAGRGVAGARCVGQVPGAARSRASPMSAPISRASAAACRPTSTCTCRARSIACPSIALHVARGADQHRADRRDARARASPRRSTSWSG